MTEWLALAPPTATSTLSPSSKILVSSLTADEKNKLPFTITRTIGILTVLSDTVATKEVSNGAFSAAVVSQRAVTTGITALPDPVTEAGADFWFLYQPWSIIRQVSNNSGSVPFVMMFDSRAQRKVPEGSDIAFVMANASSAFTVEFAVSLRILVKLH